MLPAMFSNNKKYAILFSCHFSCAMISFETVNFEAAQKTVEILIRWLHQKPADRDLQFYNLKYGLSTFVTFSCHFSCTMISLETVNFEAAQKTVKILIRWLHQKPADLDLQYLNNIKYCLSKFTSFFPAISLDTVCLFDLILYVPSTIFQLNRDWSSWVEPVLSWDKGVLLKDHNATSQ